MATFEIQDLAGRTTKVAKDPSEYFAEWRALIDEGRQRLERARLARLGSLYERREVSHPVAGRRAS